MNVDEILKGKETKGSWLQQNKKFLYGAGIGFFVAIGFIYLIISSISVQDNTAATFGNIERERNNCLNSKEEVENQKNVISTELQELKLSFVDLNNTKNKIIYTEPTIADMYNCNISSSGDCTSCVRNVQRLEKQLEECWFNETNCNDDWKDKYNDCDDERDELDDDYDLCRDDLETCEDDLDDC